MDIYCTVCGEPWDMSELHNMADYLDQPENSIPYTEARKRFASNGCAAFNEKHNSSTVGSFKAQASSALFDLLGDDVDGIASMMEDFEYDY